MPDPSRPDDAEPIADAASAFDSGELRAFQPPKETPAAAEASPGGGYDLEVDPYAGSTLGPDPVSIDPDPLPMTGQRAGKRVRAEIDPPAAAEPEPEPPPPPRAEARARPKPKPTPEPAEGPDDEDSRDFGDDSDAEGAEVDPVWSRAAEWGPDLVRVALAGLGTLVLLWLTSGSFTLASLVLLLGGSATVLLCYPILITLERPVRITPQQAVTDFFAAASHHFPHYRRMWLLLSPAGRASGSFRDFEHFRTHWRGRVESWKRDRAGKYTPLRFEVVDFMGDKSTGQSSAKATYTVHIYVRGQDDQGPVASYKMAHGLSKGPDRMWYLNLGALPSGRS